MYIHIYIFLNRFIYPIEGGLKSTTTSGQSGPRSNGNGVVLYTNQIFGTKTSPSNTFLCHMQDTPVFFVGGTWPHCREYCQHIWIPTERDKNLFNSDLELSKISDHEINFDLNDLNTDHIVKHHRYYLLEKIRIR